MTVHRGTIDSRNRVWNDVSLAWEPERQASTAAGGGGSTQVSVSTGNVAAVGNVAHGAVDAGNPISFGGKVLVARSTTPADVDVGDRVNAWFEPSGALVVSNAEPSPVTVNWTSATPLDTTTEIDVNRMGSGTVEYEITGGTISAGALTFEIACQSGGEALIFSGQSGDQTYTEFDMAGATIDGKLMNQWRFPVQGAARMVVRLSTAIVVATGSPVVRVTLRASAVAVQPHAVVRQGDGSRLHTYVDQVAPGDGSTLLGKVVGRVATANDIGVGVLAVRDDVLGTLAAADGTYGGLRMTSKGALWSFAAMPTLESTGFSTIGNNSTSSTIVSSAASQRIKVYAYSITSTANGAAANTLTFNSSAANMLWPVVLRAISSGITGANLAVTPPAFLFATEAASPLVFKVSGSTGTYHLAISYFQEV